MNITINIVKILIVNFADKIMIFTMIIIIKTDLLDPRRAWTRFCSKSSPVEKNEENRQHLVHYNQPR